MEQNSVERSYIFNYHNGDRIRLLLFMYNHFFSRCKMNPSYNDAAMDDRSWHNSKATPEMILRELGMPHKTPIHYDRKKINLQWSQHS